MKHPSFCFQRYFFFAVATAALAQAAPVITSISSPRQLATIGHPFTLTVAATGTPAPSYQWKHNGRPILDATSSSYMIASASPVRDNGWYQVVVSDSGGATTSAVVFVNVTINLSQVLTTGNYGAWQSPVPDDLTDIVSVAAGAGHWLALEVDGTVRAWGDNSHAQATVPADLHDVVSIAASNYASFALKADGTVVSWGESWGQAAASVGASRVVSIAAGQSHVLALKADGTVIGWGWNGEGQTTPPPGLNNVVGISAGQNNSFAWRADGTAVGWGSNGLSQTSIPGNLADVIAIASGEDFSIALKSDGTVMGWGASYSGGAIVPSGLNKVVSIAAGIDHALALKTDGSVVAWGQTYTGPAGVPSGATNVVAIAAQDAYSIFLRQVPERTRDVGPVYTFTKLAGLADASGNADGAGAAARFNYPAGIAVDSGGNVYVADSANRTVRKVTPSGVVTTLTGFTTPTAVAVDQSGDVYVADAGSGVIRKANATGAVTVLAGTPGGFGSSDGIGGAARFDVPSGIALDGNGNLFVIDTDFGALADTDGNNVVRKVTRDGVVTTLAGAAHQYGSADGQGASARFRTGYVFSGVAVDRAGNVYLADSGNNMIRKITADGTVSTLVGRASTSSDAQFIVHSPRCVAVDSSGNLFVTEGAGIVKITPDGIVTTVMNSSIGSAQFRYPAGVAVDGAGNLYVADYQANVIYKGTPSGALLTPHLSSQTVSPGSTVVLSANPSGSLPSTFQWTKDGFSLSGANSGTLVITGAGPANAGDYMCSVTDANGTYISEDTTLTVSSTAVAGRIVNLSTRAPAGNGPRTLILGLVTRSSDSNTKHPLLLRGVGPSLAAFDVAGFLANPKLELFSSGIKIMENDDWLGDAQVATIGSRVGAFPLGGATSKDSALFLPSVASGIYTMLVTGADGATGVALAEIYDATPAEEFSSTTARLVNASARAQVGTGSGVLIIGFVIGGETSKTLLIRAVGPSLAAFGVSDVLADPKLQLYSGSSQLRENDNWSTEAAANSAAFKQVGAFSLASDSKDAALLVTLPPGVYTAHVSGVNGSTGVALVELYEVP